MDYTQRLRDLRADHDMSQAAIAAAIGIDQKQYSRYETGINELPLRYLVKLCQVYQVSADYLQGRPPSEGARGVVVHALRAYKKGAEYSAPFLGTISELKGFYFVELEIYPLSIGVIPVSLIACTSACVYQQDGYCTLERASSCGVPCAESPCVNFVPRRNCGTTATPTKARPAPHGCCGPE